MPDGNNNLTDEEIDQILDGNDPQKIAEELVPIGLGEKIGSAARSTVSGALQAGAAAFKALGAISTERGATSIGLTDTVLPPDPTENPYREQQQIREQPPEKRLKNIEESPSYRFGTSLEDIAKDYRPTEGLETSFLFTDVPSGIGSMGVAVPSFLAGGPAGGMAAMFLMETGDAWDREIKRQRDEGETLNPDKALLKSMGYGALSAAIESGLGAGMVSRQLQRAFGGTAKQAATKAAQRGVLGSFLKLLAKNTAAGGAQEGLQRAAQDLIVDGELNPNAIMREAGAGASRPRAVRCAGKLRRGPAGVEQSR